MASPTTTHRAALPVTALLLTVGVFVSSLWSDWPIYARTTALVAGVVAALALYTAEPSQTVRPRPRVPAWSAKAVASAVFAGCGVLLVLAGATGGRGIAFHLIAGLLGSLLLFQLWLTETPRPNWTLASLLILAATVRFAALVTTPGYIGLDIWSHLPAFASGIAAQESLEAIAGDKYAISPLYHLSVIVTALLADLSLRTALFLSVGIGMLVAPLFVYLIARAVLEPRWALFGATIYTLADHVVLWGIYLVPTSLGLLFFLGVLYALFGIIRRGYTFANSTLFFAFLLGVVFTHQVSSFIAACVIGAAVLAQLVLSAPRLYPARPANLIWVFFGCLSLVVGLWAITPYSGTNGSFTDTVLVFLREAHQTTSGVAIEYGVPEADYGMRPLDSATQLVEAAGFLLLAIIAGFGAVHTASRKRADQSTLTLIFGAAVMGVFLLVPALLGIRTFLPGRWFAFLFVPLVILGAVGLKRLDRRLDPRTTLAFLVLFALVFPLTMAVSAPATVEDPVFDERPQYAFSEAELTGMETIGERTDETVYTDYLYAETFDRTNSQHAQSATNAGEDEPYVYREYQSTETPLFGTDHNQLETEQVDRETVCTGHYTYDNGHVTLCP